jgi:hypothetical protein
MSQALMNALNGDDRIKDKVNRTYNPYFDTAKVTNATTKSLFFVNGVGQGASAYNAAVTKSDADTNWPASQYLPLGTSFACGAIRLILDATSLATGVADLILFLRTCVFRLKVAGKERIGPLTAKMFPGGTGVMAALATTASATTLEVGVFGNADPRAITTLGALPIKINGQERVEASLEWPHGAPAMTGDVYAHVMLDGIRQEPI